jgi:ABC-2 type transport system permease protein
MTGHTIHLRARGALIWSAALGALGALFVALYPSISGSGASIEQMMSSMPAAMRDMIGYGGDAFSSVEGWLAGEMLSFLVPLALSFFPILVASSAIAGAEENGTMDMLLGNPLSRSQFALARFAAAAILLLGIVTLMGAVTWLTGIIVDVDLGLGAMAAASLSLWSLCIFFGGIALLLSAALHRRFLALAIPATLLILMYFVDGLASSVKFFDAIKPLSAFNYYGSAIQNGMDWTSFGVLTGATAALVSVALLIFLRRDIYS